MAEVLSRRERERENLLKIISPRTDGRVDDLRWIQLGSRVRNERTVRSVEPIRYGACILVVILLVEQAKSIRCFCAKATSNKNTLIITDASLEEQLNLAHHLKAANLECFGLSEVRRARRSPKAETFVAAQRPIAVCEIS